MIKQECIGIPDMILLLMIFCFKKIKIKAEIVLSPGGAYFVIGIPFRILNKHPNNFQKFNLVHGIYGSRHRYMKFDVLTFSWIITIN